MVVLIILANYFDQFFFEITIPERLKQINFNIENIMNEFFFMFITSTYISSICSIFDICWIIKLVKRWLVKK